MLRRTFAGAAPAAALHARQAAGAGGRPALLGGTPVRPRSSRFPGWPQVTAADEGGWLEVFRSGRWWRKEGHFVRDFEKAWAARTGARHCLATANGTSALMAALHAVDVGPRDEVIVGPYTFIATVNAILAHYALPVFADTDPDSAMIDASKIEAAITPRTRCILPVHLGGNMADMDRIMEIARRRNLAVVEDACQAVGSEWRGRKAATIGHLGCFSFHKLKNLSGGEAGAVLTNDEALFGRAYGFHSHYRTPDENAPDPKLCLNGINLRMSEFQAAAMLAQIGRLEEQARTRDRNAAYLNQMLLEKPGVAPAKVYPGCTRNGYHLYMMRYNPEAMSGLSRERFVEAVRAEGIPISAGYTPLNRHPFLENTLNSRPFRAIYSQQEIARWRERNRCPNNDRLCQEGLWFPHTVLLGSRRDMEDIIAGIRKVQRHAAELK
ncbi:MAG: DegT/DnrJ/EryC1/StrS family aminotransferase [Bryobacterales bacterium]|nr:DegT/DnrJ/EryC1/StrS family aminotransferase [Bryobacterales bacterium]